MKIQKYALKILILLVFTIINNGVNAQSELKVFQDWKNTNGSQNFFKKNVVKTDASGNIFIAGATLNSSNNYDIIVAKYNSYGVLQWTQQYNGAGNSNDMALGLYIDGSGNVLITGFITTATNIDMVTVKYNSSGTQQWMSTFNGIGNGYDSGADITGDASGNVYVTGMIYNSYNTDVETIKYNSSGTQQWAKRYNYASNMNDGGVKLVVNAMGVAVSIIAQIDTLSYRYGVIIYNPTSGNLVTSTINGSSSTGIDQVSDMVQDASGNIYIAGAVPVAGQGYNYDIIKLNSNLGLSWERTYSGNDGLNDIATGLEVDGSGNVFVTGTSETNAEGKNIVTLKYNSSGTLQWSRTYNDTLNKDDEASAMAMDATGNIYITGSCATEADSTNYLTIKYDASGNLLWTILSDGDAHLDDMANNIALDSIGDIIVTGESRTSSGSFEYMTIKYVEKQIITPTDYNAETPASSFSYYTNKGQLINTNDSLIPEINYYTNGSSPAFYFKDNSSSFVFAHVDANDSTSDTLHRIDMSFEKINSTAKTYPMEETRDYLNYFLPQCPDGITKVHGNKRLVTTGLYSNIDLIYSSNQNGIKMYFIIKPGGNPADLQLLFSGASSFYLDTTSNALTINSSIGNITFDRPTAYQLTSSNTIVQITGWQCAWQTNGADSTYKFYTGAYDNTKALVIQVDCGNIQIPIIQQEGNLWWSSNYGAQNGDDNMGLDIISDPATRGSYIVGRTNSSNFPVNSNLNTGYFGGITDGFIVSFDKYSVLKWSTFFGGNGIDILKSIVYSVGTQNIYVTGSSSSTNIPPYPSTNPNNGSFYKTTNSGGNDALIARIDLTGQILWWSYIGGTGNDEGLSITADRLGCPYITGNTTSTTASNNCQASTGTEFPLCNSYGGSSFYQGSNSGGQDIFIAKFSLLNELLWSTFYGSDADDNVYEINYSGDGGSFDILIVGKTSKNSPPPNPPTLVYTGQPRSDGYFPLCEFNGNNDFFQAAPPNGNSTIGFISRFTLTGEETWSTTFYQITEFQTVTSRGENIYVAGYKNPSAEGISFCGPITPDPMDLPKVPICDDNGGYFHYAAEDQLYIAKFHKNDNELIWSTNYPGWTNLFELNAQLWNGFLYDITPNEMKTLDITTDAASNLYLLGNGIDGINTLQLSGAYFKPFNNIPVSDAYILNFNSYNELKWATYFGTDAPTGFTQLDHPQYSDWCGAITAFETQDLYITGYSGCGHSQGSANCVFPWASPGIQPTGTPWLYVGNCTSFPFYKFESYISRFDLSSIGVDIRENTKSESSLTIYPNPVNDNYFYVSFPFIKSGKYKVINMLGEVKFSEVIQNTDEILINIESLNSGCYVIQVEYDNIVKCGKFIKY